MSDTATRPVRARRIHFNYPEGGLERHYVQGDLVMSHVLAYLSSTFPEGEDFFVRSVRHYADQVTDPVLKDQVKGFIGQEVTHSREHVALNERLEQMGYPTRYNDRFTARSLRWDERRFSPLTCLAMTAALEHFTAVFAESLLGDEDAQALLGSTEVRKMLLWHAYEESEHRAVAFDVYRTVGGSERRRIWTMRMVTLTFFGSIVAFTTLSMLRDRATYNPVRLFGSLWRLRRSPFLKRSVLQRFRKYNTVGFHPNDVDNTALLERWQPELFGETGQLAHNMADGPVSAYRGEGGRDR
ncbi:metal-dependent hydrolase [Mycolicibacterium llatzerense]|uniref:metal-dependent hydrolase n=1 Tax=Mycolicibacterium llatzerense TaxID=280871 RepID=UPI0021B6B3DB|nr:metal-dependent hydrolase [Mycolicibacterium llatzerense]MCT7364394.1 metal-dependent hydrolase [Mycolicibacterium llatzerense]